MNLEVQISWRAQHLVNLEAQISWQAQYFVNFEVQISWQAQYFGNLEAQVGQEHWARMVVVEVRQGYKICRNSSLRLKR